MEKVYGGGEIVGHWVRHVNGCENFWTTQGDLSTSCARGLSRQLLKKGCSQPIQQRSRARLVLGRTTNLRIGLVEVLRVVRKIDVRSQTQELHRIAESLSGVGTTHILGIVGHSW